MKEPTHTYKRLLGRFDGNIIFDVYGWLGSGLKDRNGKEIFEGDIVKEIVPPDCANYDGRQLVIFRRGEFLLVRECEWARLETCGATPLSWAGLNSIEVIGHISEEQQ